MSEPPPERDENPPDAHLEDAWDETTDGTEAGPLPPGRDPDHDADPDEDEDPAFAAWLLRLEDDIEEQRFAQADQFDEDWRR